MKLTKQQKNNIDVLIDILTKVTVRIISYNEAGTIIGRASGFLYQAEPNTVPVVITAGHKLPEAGSFIETRVKEDGKPLQINAGQFNIFYNSGGIDYAYSRLPVDLYKKDLQAYEGVYFIAYQHKFIKAEKNEGYGFAVYNDYELVRMGDDFGLPRYLCYELFLELVEQDEHINYFKVAREFQGHDYYRGASGSPIVDQEGAITSILIGGDEEKGILKGFRLDNIEIVI